MGRAGARGANGNYRITPKRSCLLGSQLLIAAAAWLSAPAAWAVTCPTNGTWSADIPVKITVKDHPNLPGTNFYTHNQDYLWYLSVPPLVNDVKIHWPNLLHRGQ